MHTRPRARPLDKRPLGAALAVLGGNVGMLGGSMMNGASAVSVFSGSLLVRIGLTGAAFALPFGTF